MRRLTWVVGIGMAAGCYGQSRPATQPASMPSTQPAPYGNHFKEHTLRQLSEQEEKARVALKAAQSTPVGRAGGPGSIQEKRRTIIEAKSRLETILGLKKAAERGDYTLVPMMPPSYAVGDAGKVKGLRVIQVVDRQNARVDLMTTYDVYADAPLSPTAFEMRHATVWIRTDTSGWVDDQYRTLPGTWQVVGTKRYITVMGAATTIPLVEPLR